MAEQTISLGDLPRASHGDLQFGVIDLRLNGRDWLIVGAIVTTILALLPTVAQRTEVFAPGRDYRVPYELSGDYWLFQQYARLAGGANRTLVIGDSVMWGEYVAGNETLPHYLNELAGTDAFANLGIDGLYPVALEGLLRYYGGEVVNKTVIMHCNPLWMASPVYDLRAGETFRFNHPALIPQGYRYMGFEMKRWHVLARLGVDFGIPYPAPRLYSRIKPYSAGLNDRLANAVVRVLPYRDYVTHWRTSRFAGQDLPGWTIDHAYENPFTVQSMSAPTTRPDPSRYDSRTWRQRKLPRVDYPWVALHDSLQWRSFQAVIQMLLDRGNRVFVIVGPFNEHMLTDDSRTRYAEIRSGIVTWMEDRGVPHFVAPLLPSEYYADASHPLAEGYKLLARQLLECNAFKSFSSLGRDLNGSDSPGVPASRGDDE